ncbi:CCG-binding protein 1 [Andrographis paniculata]|uniref:CCG-binding protein 1 n=1 Tax=Andrographis paniculata TaxID=175694 RepID=UPI0021E7B8E1|nr:CCG-binding protein 1 [Andrographis paniculata]XP_051146943.1 CCG-binding protein 1 [Andrographis paniculata]XP_051146944.1 CCG-binding protein 1 [Andrographis paniculata]XP_051146945.1 CCG-binding protein 1 [Andrographis paniculata]
MVESLPLSCAATTFLVESRSRRRTNFRCFSASRNNGYIPKLEPFSRSKIDRAFKEPPLIQKSESQIADYCSTLEGDDSYSCWKAYFELKELEKEVPKEDLERLVIEAGGVKSLIGFVHGVAAIHKAAKAGDKAAVNPASTPAARAVNPECPVPDGLPKTWEELQEEEKERMPDSAYTRLLRARGRHPVWHNIE